MPSGVDPGDEGLAVGLALAARSGRDGWPRRSRSSAFGCCRDDGGQGVDRELVALARAEQAEAQDDVATGQAERPA